mmetsp:Transcript_22941/g.33665  ORF Transcript_22941/g.33665 Transcript_22941/m.33665 type:complete len:209 (-) Transcript_22941:204-830(-)
MYTMKSCLLTLAVALSAPRSTAAFSPSLTLGSSRLPTGGVQRRSMHTSPALRMSYDPDARIKELGIDLPKVAAAAANYVPYIVSGNYVYVAGQIPVLNGEIQFKGTVPKDKTMDIAYQSARLCGLNIIAQVKDACGGDLKRVKKVVKLVGFVNSEDTFTDQPKVINGASDLMVEVFGDAGRHARSAVGVNVLPLGVTTEVEAIVEIFP